jgi:hypothetical protein
MDTMEAERTIDHVKAEMAGMTSAEDKSQPNLNAWGCSVHSIEGGCRNITRAISSGSS